MTYTIIAKKDKWEDRYYYLTSDQAAKLKKNLEEDGYIVNVIKEDALGNQKK